MNTPTHPKIAFVGWNPFQFLHFARLVPAFPDATLVVERRPKAARTFDFDVLTTISPHIKQVDRGRMAELDGDFDVLICQTPFNGIGEFIRTKIAMLQYGYAKEAHNYGPWRSLADVCLTFGDYASRKIEPFCPCVVTGNPRYSDWAASHFRSDARAKFGNQLDPSRKTILYAPTWGGLSSYSQFADAVSALSKNHNVILKVHHNSQLASSRIIESARASFDIVCDTCDDIVELLAMADVMISDFSGAIFDAIYCEVPVVLLNPSRIEGADVGKSDAYSLERARRGELGEVVSNESSLERAVETVINESDARVASLAGLRNDLFVDSTNSVLRVTEAVHGLLENKFRHSQSQEYLRNEMRSHFRCKADLAAAATIPGLARLLSLKARRLFRF